MKAKILLVEDDVYLREGMCELLLKEDYEPVSACNCKEGRRLFTEDSFDLVILDVMLPDGNGLDLCSFIRSTGADVPILFLTACDEEFQIVRGLDAGADDYVTKPFRLLELLSRIRALLRRKTTTTTYQFGNILVDISNMTVKKDGETLFLTPTEFQILSALIQNNGVIVTRASLLQRIWDSITSNLEKLPYYAYSMAMKTEKTSDKPAKDSELFSFAAEPDWKEKLDSTTLQKVKALISDYETARKRIRFLTHTEKDMKRQNDVYRILMSRGQEKDFSVDEIYTAFDKMSSYQVRLARQQLIAGDWQFTPPEERVRRFYEITDCVWDSDIVRLFCDFRCGGYRMLGDVISDFDDMHRNRSLKKNYLSQKGDTSQMKAMVSGIKHTSDAKNQIISNCKHLMFPIRTINAAPSLNPEDVVKCAVALGKRKFALEVLPDTVLRLTLDSNIPTKETIKKKWRLWQ